MVNALLRLIRFVVIMAILSAVMVGSLLLIAPQAGKLVSAHRSDHEQLDLKPLTERSLMFDRNGDFVASLIGSGNINRAEVPLKQVPRTVRASIIAAEDNDFYRHIGVNVRSIGRAIDANLASGQIEQGGSTISQQVIKDSQVGNKQDFKRKIREALLALELEKEFSKNQILSRYVNSVYFGNGAYGVQAAAQVYFNKDVSTLNWAEGALLAALIRSPSQYDPIKNPKLAEQRRNIVFRRLRETGRLTADQIKVFQTQPLPAKVYLPTQVNDYLPEYVKQQLLDDPRYGLGNTPAARANAVFGGGLRIYTTFDPVAQQKAIAARNQTVAGIPGGRPDGTFPVTYTDATGRHEDYGTEAIVSIQPNNGAVRVMVGGPGFKQTPLNLALRERQPGSSMKTYVLATLFENGFVPDDRVSGASCAFRIPKGAPYATTGKGGTNTITAQTEASNNCAFLRLGQVVGLPKVVDMATRLGVTADLDAPLQPGQPPFIPLTLPIGSQEVSPFDQAAAYAVLSNDGVRNEPYVIERIEDSDGRVIYQHQAAPQRVINSETARLVNQVLQKNVEAGTGKRAKLLSGQPAAGKTGTTNKSSDVWFVGYTPQMATAIWMGAVHGNHSLDGAGIAGATGGRFPASTWGSYTTQLLAGQPIVGFAPAGPTRPGKDVGKIPNEIPYRSSYREGNR